LAVQISLRSTTLVACAAAFVFLTPAHADTFETFTLNVDGCTSGCGNGLGTTNNNFATVLLDDNGAGTVTVTETLHGTDFVNSSGKEAIAFVLPTLTNLAINVQTTGYAVATGTSFSMAPFGTFDEAIHCNVCGNGGSNPQPGPLVFTVTAQGGVTLASFGATGGDYFASDVLGNGTTGDVAANKVGVFVTPEPASILLSLGGIALLGFRRLRHKHN
jgi:hypothetical protein